MIGSYLWKKALWVLSSLPGLATKANRNWPPVNVATPPQRDGGHLFASNGKAFGEGHGGPFEVMLPAVQYRPNRLGLSDKGVSVLYRNGLLELISLNLVYKCLQRATSPNDIANSEFGSCN